MPPAQPLPTTRSAVTNGSRVHQNVDHRSASARRYRDLVLAYTAEIGTNLTESEVALIRQCAALTLRAEQLAADVVNGKNVDDDLLVRLAGTSRRLLEGIGNKAGDRKPDTTLTLADHLARRATEFATDNNGE
jgi:hypothetical protein